MKDETFLRKASLIAGLELFGYQADSDAIRWAQTWNIDLTGRKTGGLVWRYPPRIWTLPISARVIHDWERANYDTQFLDDFVNKGLSTMDFEYTFTIEGDRIFGYDTSPPCAEAEGLFSPEVISEETYTYNPDIGICHTVYDLRSMDEVRALLMFKLFAKGLIKMDDRTE